MGRQQNAGIAFGEIHLNDGASIFNRLFAHVDGRGIYVSSWQVSSIPRMDRYGRHQRVVEDRSHSRN
jgi:hypothetical protein